MYQTIDNQYEKNHSNIAFTMTITAKKLSFDRDTIHLSSNSLSIGFFMHFIKIKHLFFYMLCMSVQTAYGEPPCQGQKGYYLYHQDPSSGEIIKGGFIAKTVKIKTKKHWWGPLQGLRTSHSVFLSTGTQICDNVTIKGTLKTVGKVIISDHAYIDGNIVINNKASDLSNAFSHPLESPLPIHISGYSKILDHAAVHGSAHIQDSAQISEYAEIYDHSVIYGNAMIQGYAKIRGHSHIGHDVTVKDFSVLQQSVKLKGNITCQDNSFLDGSIEIYNTGANTHVSLKEETTFLGESYIQTNRNTTYDGGTYLNYQYEDKESPVPDNAVEHIYPPEILEKISQEIHPKDIHHEQTCCICLDSIKDCGKTVQFSGCKHIFHKTCAMSWVRYKLSCPLCNKNFNEAL